MLGISSPQSTINPDLPAKGGGFLWWYADLLDDQGNGIVLIWSLNLPFLPDVSYGLRAGDRPVPAQHPSLNIVVHKEGKPAFYLLQQHGPGEWEWDPAGGTWRVGATRICLKGSTKGRARLEATLDCSVPETGERLTGTVVVEGARRLAGDTVRTGSVHLWCPLITATEGNADLAWGDQRLQVTGRAYVDRNESPVGLTELGIDRWWWGRLPFSDHELIWYRLDSKDPAVPSTQFLLRVEPDGQSRLSEGGIALGPTQTGWYGLSYPATLDLTEADGTAVRVQVQEVTDDGPFYQRFVVVAERGGERVHGVAELVVPDRIALPGMRRLIDMKVHQASRSNSFWLPLFAGGAHHRLGKLLGRRRPPVSPRPR